MTDSYREPASEPLIVHESSGGGKSTVVALDIATGNESWKVELPSTYGSGKSSMAIGAGLVVIGFADGMIYCVEHATGRSLVSGSEQTHGWQSA